MPDQLPETQICVNSSSSGEKPKSHQFPNIFRFITERIFAQGNSLKFLKLSISLLSSVLLLNMAISQGLQLRDNIQLEKRLLQERNNIEKEIIYWEKTAKKYTNYPDIYLKIASLEYRLGNSQSARDFVRKALAINPDTNQGRVLGERISR